MRTAESIAQQQEANSDKVPKIDKRGKHPNSRKNLVAPWKPGVSGNPGGEPGYDVAAALARAVIKENQVEAYNGLSASLIKGNAYVFKELAERGYGKLKEKVEHTVSDEVLQKLLAGRERLAKERSGNGPPAPVPSVVGDSDAGQSGP